MENQVKNTPQKKDTSLMARFNADLDLLLFSPDLGLGVLNEFQKWAGLAPSKSLRK